MDGYLARSLGQATRFGAFLGLCRSSCCRYTTSGPGTEVVSYRNLTFYECTKYLYYSGRRYRRQVDIQTEPVPVSFLRITRCPKQEYSKELTHVAGPLVCVHVESDLFVKTKTVS